MLVYPCILASAGQTAQQQRARAFHGPGNFGDIGNILAYLSIGDRIQEVERLVSALAEIRRLHQRDKTGMLTQEYIPPERYARAVWGVAKARGP